MTDEDPFQLDDVLGYLIGRVAHDLQLGFTELMAGEGLTVRQFGVLNHVARSPGLASAEIARRLDVTPQSMVSHVETLCRRGILRRDPDPGPGRAIGVHLTPEGAALLARARVLARDYEDRTTGHLDAEGRRRLASELREIRRRALAPPDTPPGHEPPDASA
jgi:DNA-binding MarR family transcriptional regulator